MSDEKTPEMLAEAYRIGAVTGWAPAARGWAGEIFRLVTSSGAYAAKEFLTQRPDVARIERQVAFSDACRSAGVPNPETLSTVHGGLLVDHPVTGRPWLVQRWADGTVPERTDLPTACWLARQAATIHRLAVPCDPAEPVNPFYTVARTGWAEIAETARGAGFAWAERASGPDGVEVFATGLAVWLNFLYGQICGALDPAMDDRFQASAQESAGHLVDGIPGLDSLHAAARCVALV